MDRSDPAAHRTCESSGAPGETAGSGIEHVLGRNFGRHHCHNSLRTQIRRHRPHTGCRWWLHKHRWRAIPVSHPGFEPAWSVKWRHIRSTSVQSPPKVSTLMFCYASSGSLHPLTSITNHSSPPSDTNRGRICLFEDLRVALLSLSAIGPSKRAKSLYFLQMLKQGV